ncbi:MAG: S1 RNA-binding domain-containing protein [Oligoflexales bacterium]
MTDKKFEVQWEDQDTGFDEASKEHNENNSDEFQKMLANESTDDIDFEPPAVGDKVIAKISYIGKDSDDIMLEIGGKSSAVIAKQDLFDEQGQLNSIVGDEVSAFVVSIIDGEIVLSNSMSHSIAKKHAVEAAYESKVPVKGKVTATQKGGYEVFIMGRKAFCPVSHIDNRFVENPEEYVGKELDFRIQKIGRDLVVSRSLLLDEQAKTAMISLKECLSKGTSVDGKVADLKDFGAMIDLGGVTGMAHISELSFGHPSHASEVLKIGQKVKAKILNIDESGKKPRIGLSIKALLTNPWDSIEDHFKMGESYRGQVIRLADFGAFVELKEGVDGLIHLSEMSWLKRIHHPKEILKVGDQVLVRLLELNPLKKRISLSMKAIEDDPWLGVEERFQLGMELDARVVELKSFGAVVELAEGLTGTVPTFALKAAHGDSYRKKCCPPNELKVLVQEVNKGKKRITLTLQSLKGQENDADDYKQYLAQQDALQVGESKSQGSFGDLLQASIKKKP